MQVSANSVNLIRGGNVIKQGDETPLTFQLNNDLGTLVNLTGATVTARMANSRIVVLEKEATVNEDNTITFNISSDDTTGHGQMRLEFVVTHEDGEMEIFPAQGYQEILITPSLGEIDAGEVSVITIEQFEKRVNESVTQANEAAEYATEQGDYAKSEADRLEGTDVSQLDRKIEDGLNSLSQEVAQNTQDYLNLGKASEGGTSDKDNYSKLVSLISKAKSEKKGLYIPNGKYYCSEDLSISFIKNIIIDGEIVMAPGKTLELTFNSTDTEPLNWSVYKVNGKLRLSGIKNGNIKVFFAKELELYANGDDVLRSSIAFSQFHLGTIDRLTLFSEGTKSGWINENSFYGGRIEEITIDGNYPHNNNSFFKPMLELSNINIISGIYNTFYDVRFEASNTVNFGAKSQGNIIEKSYVGGGSKGEYLRKPHASIDDTGETTINDQGVSNHVYYKLDNVTDIRSVYELNSYSNNFDLSNFIRGEHSLTPKRTGSFFKTGLIPVKEDMGVHALSDKRIFRFYVYLYDANKQLLTVNPTDSYGGLDITFNGTYGYLYGANNHNVLELAVFNNSQIKYIQIDARITTVEPFEYLRISLRTPKRAVVPTSVPFKYKSCHSRDIPAEGYWEAGDIVWNVGTDASVAFWKRLTTGTNHVLDTDWKAHG